MEGKQPYFKLIVLIMAGTSSFYLPFGIARVFRPTFLDVFSITNLDLGLCFSVYGVIALFSYFFGGGLADRIAPNVLIASSLFMTAAGGLYMATYPSIFGLKVLYGYWGFTTVFLFWAAMIKATRMWGGSSNQLRAFAFLDGGRGLVATLLGSMGVLVFGSMLTEGIATISIDDKKNSFSSVIYITSAFVIIVGILCLIFLRSKGTDDAMIKDKIGLGQIVEVLKIRSVWYLMVIILCAYFGYKVTDIGSLYANEVMGYDEISSANLATFLLFLRPVMGLMIGLFASSIKSANFLVISFVFLLAGSSIFASGVNSPNLNLLFLISVIILAVGAYSARTLYFAVLQEGRIPLYLTGTAVGIISFIGYTPDIFSGPLIGVLLDNNPGEYGHQLVFAVLGIFSIIGLIAAIGFKRFVYKGKSLS
ncbi:MFS transporter [Winogradskyella sp. A2]|uniref:MFS transporter n=1 Tax=Winogradskyella sp. A2 TaxID=3366944 RepID=UPI00398C6F7D